MLTSTGQDVLGYNTFREDEDDDTASSSISLLMETSESLLVSASWKAVASPLKVILGRDQRVDRFIRLLGRSQQRSMQGDL